MVIYLLFEMLQRKPVMPSLLCLLLQKPGKYEKVGAYGMHMGLSVQNTCTDIFLQKVNCSLFKLYLETSEVHN